MRNEVIEAVLILGEWPTGSVPPSKIPAGSYFVDRSIRTLRLKDGATSAKICDRTEFEHVPTTLLNEMPEGATLYRTDSAVSIEWYTETHFWAPQRKEWMGSFDRTFGNGTYLSLDKLKTQKPEDAMGLPEVGTHCMVSNPAYGGGYECIIIPGGLMMLNRDPETAYWDVVKPLPFSLFYPIPPEETTPSPPGATHKWWHHNGMTGQWIWCKGVTGTGYYMHQKRGAWKWHPYPLPPEAIDLRRDTGRPAWLFNPYTGKRRDLRDVGSDPFGDLICP